MSLALILTTGDHGDILEILTGRDHLSITGSDPGVIGPGQRFVRTVIPVHADTLTHI